MGELWNRLSYHLVSWVQEQLEIAFYYYHTSCTKVPSYFNNTPMLVAFFYKFESWWWWICYFHGYIGLPHIFFFTLINIPFNYINFIMAIQLDRESIYKGMSWKKNSYHGSNFVKFFIFISIIKYKTYCYYFSFLML